MMIRLSSFTLITILCFSCNSHNHQSEKRPASSQTRLQDLDVDSIKLLVGDSSVFRDWQQQQYTGKVIPVADHDVGFVDSVGKAAHTPMQVLRFDSTESKILLVLFDDIQNQPQSDMTTGCIHFYKHVFQCFSKDRMVKQISLSSMCDALYIEPDKKQIENYSRESVIFEKVVALMKRKGAYLYEANSM